jgi:hypothetical protein
MHTHARRLWLAAPAILLITLLSVPSSALAHERRTIGNGKYDIVVGWDVEPAYSDFKNAASIRIFEAGSSPAVPIAGAEKTLKVQIRQGAATREFPLRAVFGQPGYYVADIVPTRAGDYQFSFVGALNEEQVNERFDSADGKFNGVEAAAALQFPQTLPDPMVASAAVSSAQAEAQSARTLAMIGIGVGVLGLLAALAAWFTRPRTPQPLGRPSTERA